MEACNLMTEPTYHFVLHFTEEGADITKLDTLSRDLVKNIRIIGANQVSVGESQPSVSNLTGVRGEPITIGTIFLVITPILLNQLIDYLKTIWLNKRREIEFEYKTSTGVVIKFKVTPDTNLSEIKKSIEEVIKQSNVLEQKTVEKESKNKKRK